MKILILTAPFGSGHLQVSNALVKEFSDHKEVVVEEYDMYSNEFPVIAKTIQKAYLKSYKPIGKDIYRMLYYTSSHVMDETIYAKMLTPLLDFGIQSLRRKVDEFKPDLIISVFPVTSLYHLLKSELNVPLYTVITDYYANGLWLSRRARRHYVANNRIINWGVSKGFRQDQFELTGIPIHPKFYQELDSTELYEKYELDVTKKTILIAAGTHGVLPNVSEITKELTKEPNIQVMVVCGKNEKLYKELNTIEVTNQNLLILGYTKEMHELLEMADVMITKPGGISLTEAAIKGVPVLLYNPVYGQELENAKYFSEKMAGLIVSSKTEIISALLMMLNTPEALDEMKQNIKDLSNPFSAQKIVKDILEDMKSVSSHEPLVERDDWLPIVPTEQMPVSIKDLYVEARNVYLFSPRSACALLRLAIHTLSQELIQQDLNGKDISDILKDKRLPTTVTKILDSENLTGDGAVQPGVINLEDNKEVAATLFIVLNIMVEKLVNESQSSNTWHTQA